MRPILVVVMFVLARAGSISAVVLNKNGLNGIRQSTTAGGVLYKSGFLGIQQSLQYVSARTTRDRNKLCRRYTGASSMVMMPEGPEVRTIVDQLQGTVGKRLVDIRFLSGRYVRNGKPENFHAFAKTMSPVFQPHSHKPETIDIIQEWNCKGKFMYIKLDDGSPASKLKKHDHEDFERSIWVTLGMTGQFVNEETHLQDVRFARWFLEVMDCTTMESNKIYYHDQRNFGTLRFCLSKDQLTKKLQSLGPDILSPETTKEDFLKIVSRQRPGLNVCKFLMDQAKVAGVGNYILSEGLYRAMIDPFASLDEIDEDRRCRLFQEIKKVGQESYQSQGLTRQDGGTFRNIAGEKGKFEFQLQCYGRKECAEGNPVIRETDGPHKRTIWYTEQQLLKPRSMRETESTKTVTTTSSSRLTTTKVYDNTTSNGDGNIDTVQELISSLEDPSWKDALADTIDSGSFRELALFVHRERMSGETIYPPQDDIFSAFNLCPLDSTKVVIVGQDPYHGPGQGHGLAFSVRHGVNPPPSLKNIFREAMDDVSIEAPVHGNLEHWAKQGVLLLNTVLTVRRGKANSHSKVGWEEFTDAVIRELNDKRQGLVFLLWGNPAAKKGRGVDESKHVVIRTSHPSPLGATKTSSPFLGSRCFSRTNEALSSMNKTLIDWNVR